MSFYTNCMVNERIFLILEPAHRKRNSYVWHYIGTILYLKHLKYLNKDYNEYYIVKERKSKPTKGKHTNRMCYYIQTPFILRALVVVKNICDNFVIYLFACIRDRVTQVT